MGHIAELPSDGPHQHRLRDAFEREEKRYNKLKGRIKWNIKKKKRNSGIDQKGITKDIRKRAPLYGNMPCM